MFGWAVHLGLYNRSVEGFDLKANSRLWSKFEPLEPSHPGEVCWCSGLILFPKIPLKEQSQCKIRRLETFFLLLKKWPSAAWERVSVDP